MSRFRRGDGSKEASLIVRRRSTPAQTTQPVPTHTIRVHTKTVRAVAFFKDGRCIVTASKDRTLRIWNVEKRECVGGPFEGHSDVVTSVTVSPDDRRIASGGDDGAIIIWNVQNKQMLFKPLEKHMHRVSSVCFSPDGKRLASGSWDETVIIWDAETGAVLSTLECWSSVSCVAFSPDGLRLAYGLYRNIRIWSTDNAEVQFDIKAHDNDWVYNSIQVMWSSDGQQLVSASNDETIKFWDSSNGSQIGQPCTGHTSSIRSLAISSDGLFNATASDDYTVRMWDIKSHK